MKENIQMMMVSGQYEICSGLKNNSSSEGKRGNEFSEGLKEEPRHNKTLLTDSRIHPTLSQSYSATSINSLLPKSLLDLKSVLEPHLVDRLGSHCISQGSPSPSHPEASLRSQDPFH